MHFRGSSVYLGVVALSQTSAVLAAVPAYGQCGGMNFKGDTTCADGWTCVKSNDWYSQCVSGGANNGGSAPPAGTGNAPAPTSVVVVPSAAPAPSMNATEPVAAPSTLSTLISSPTAVAEPAEACEADDDVDEAGDDSEACSADDGAADEADDEADDEAETAAPDVAGSGANGASCSLDAAFKAAGKKYVGVATDQGLLGKGQNKQIIIDNFGQVTPENSMKWDATEGTQGQFTLDGANALVDFATENKKLIRGHTTVWHSQLPTWVSSITDKTKLEEVMVAHIKKLMGTYAGKVYAWDVVNEIFAEDGNFRSSVFYNVLGEDFVATAFQTARAADPDAKLYINDYNLDSPTYAKTKAMATNVAKWVAAGVPIDGIGSQSHLSGSWPISDYPAALKSLCDVVSECAMTELDIKGGAAADYKTAVNACLDVDNCVGVTVWGVSDNDSWIGADATPLLFDGSFKAKEAYNGLCSALGA